MTYREFSDNEKYEISTSDLTKKITPEVDIIPFTHTPDNENTREDGKITIADLKTEFTQDIVDNVTALQQDFVSFAFVDAKPTNAGDLKKHILYFWKNEDTGVYKCFFVNELSDGSRSLGEIGGRTFYVGDLNGNKSTDADTSDYGLTIDDVNGIISNALVQKGGTIHGNLTVAKNGDKNGDLKVNGKIDVDGDVSIGGNLTVEGTVTKADSISTENNYIQLREGATAALADAPADGGDNSLSYTGLEANHYDDDGNVGQLVFDKTGTARVGDKGKTQPIATRSEESEMSDGELVFWNKTARKLETKTETIGSTSEPVYISAGKPSVCNDLITATPDVIKSSTYDGSIVNDTVQSDGTTGFAIDKNGKADLGNVTARGDTEVKGVLTASKELDSPTKTVLKGTTDISGITTFADTTNLNGTNTFGGTATFNDKATFNDEIDISGAAFTSAVSVAQGGTGQTTVANAFNSLASSISEQDADADDNMGFLTTKGNALDISTDSGVQKRTGLHIWNWIKTKISNVLGIGINSEGKLAISKQIVASSIIEGSITGSAGSATTAGSATSAGKISHSDISATTTLVEVTSSTDGYTVEARLDAADELEIRHTLKDDVSAAETWYGQGANTIKLMSLQPTGSGTTISGANLEVNGDITANNFNGLATQATKDGSGNVITTTYATKNSLSSASVNYAASAGSANSVAWANVTDKPTFTISGNTLTITTA